MVEFSGNVGEHNPVKLVEDPQATVKLIEFFPKEKGEYDGDVIFIPGAASEPDSKILNSTGKKLSEITGSNVSIFITRTDTIEEDFLEIEMRKLANEIEASGRTHIRLMGQSEGGLKAIVLAHILQENGKVTIDNLGLIDSMGLYGQDSAVFFKKFNKDSAISTPIEITKNTILDWKKNHNIFEGPRRLRKIFDNFSALPPAIVAGMGVGRGLLKERLRSGKEGFKERSQNEIEHMSQATPYLSELGMPIVLINGLLDPISSPEVLTPNNLPNEKMIPRVNENSEREQYLKKNFFSSSPDVKAIYAEKLGNHGLLFYRPEQVMSAVWYLMNRQSKNQVNRQAA